MQTTTTSSESRTMMNNMTDNHGRRTIRLQLSFRATNLPTIRHRRMPVPVLLPRWKKKPSPFVVLSSVDDNGGSITGRTYRELDRTEIVHRTCDPEWATILVVDYYQRAEEPSYQQSHNTNDGRQGLGGSDGSNGSNKIAVEIYHHESTKEDRQNHGDGGKSGLFGGTRDVKTSRDNGDEEGGGGGGGIEMYDHSSHHKKNKKMSSSSTGSRILVNKLFFDLDELVRSRDGVLSQKDDLGGGCIYVRAEESRQQQQQQPPTSSSLYGPNGEDDKEGAGNSSKNGNNSNFWDDSITGLEVGGGSDGNTISAPPLPPPSSSYPAPSSLTLQLRAMNLDNDTLFMERTHYCYCIIRRKQIMSTGNTWGVVYRSQSKNRSINPLWETSILDLERFCNNTMDRPILISVYDVDSYGTRKLLGECETTVEMLIEARSERGNADQTKAFVLVDTARNNKSRGKLVVVKAELT